MARNVALVRVLRMVERLREKRWTVYELADEFNVTSRTVRRDIDVMAQAGIAIKSQPMDGQSTQFWVKGR